MTSCIYVYKYMDMHVHHKKSAKNLLKIPKSLWYENNPKYMNKIEKDRLCCNVYINSILYFLSYIILSICTINNIYHCNQYSILQYFGEFTLLLKLFQRPPWWETNPSGWANGQYDYYPYRAFGGQKKIHALCDKEGNIINIARALFDQSFNNYLRLQYVVRIHSSEIRAMPRPP